jgi:hypothetical protein
VSDTEPIDLDAALRMAGELERARAERDEYVECITNLTDGEVDHAELLSWLRGSFENYDRVLRGYDQRGDALAAAEAREQRLRKAVSLALETLRMVEWAADRFDDSTCWWCLGTEPPELQPREWYDSDEDYNDYLEARARHEWGHKPDCKRQSTIAALEALAGQPAKDGE